MQHCSALSGMQWIFLGGVVCSTLRCQYDADVDGKSCDLTLFQVLRINKGPTNELGIIITGSTPNPFIIKSLLHKIRHEHTISAHLVQT